MSRKSLIVWAWVGAAAIGPLLYIIERTLGGIGHDLALAFAVGMSIILGVICTFIVLSSNKSG